MNILILGNEEPDFKHPVLAKPKVSKKTTEGELTEDDKLIKAVRILQSSSYASDLEKLRLYYKEKSFRLKVIFELYLKKHGLFNMPRGGLRATIELHKEINITELLPQLKAIGAYNPLNNPDLNEQMPVTAIRIGIGNPNVETYEQVFELIATHLKLEATI
jgi:DNA-binding transcriptional MocR family regulator